MKTIIAIASFFFLFNPLFSQQNDCYFNFEFPELNFSYCGNKNNGAIKDHISGVVNIKEMHFENNEFWKKDLFISVHSSEDNEKKPNKIWQKYFLNYTVNDSTGNVIKDSSYQHHNCQVYIALSKFNDTYSSMIATGIIVYKSQFYKLKSFGVDFKDLKKSDCFDFMIEVINSLKFSGEPRLMQNEMKKKLLITAMENIRKDSSFISTHTLNSNDLKELSNSLSVATEGEFVKEDMNKVEVMLTRGKPTIYDYHKRFHSEQPFALDIVNFMVDNNIPENKQKIQFANCVLTIRHNNEVYTSVVSVIYWKEQVYFYKIRIR